MELYSHGWNPYFEKQLKDLKQEGHQVARIVKKNKDHYLIAVNGQPITAKISGKFRYNAKLTKDFPVVGDWVMYEMKFDNDNHAFIHRVLTRENAYERKLPISGGRKINNGLIEGGRTEEQVIASNIDTAFIVMGLDGNFDIRKVERFLSLIYQSGIQPVIILNKIDLCTDIHQIKEQLNEIDNEVPVHYVSAEKDINMDVFFEYVKFGKTVILLGSSGVGKSTITNFLVGEEKQQKQAISSTSGKGKHTTTSVELIPLPACGMIVDTPGVREVQLWGDEDILEQSFKDVRELSTYCKYRNCQHRKEPGCAILTAIEKGSLSRKRVDSYEKQLLELQRLAIKRRNFEKKINNKRK
ncbi:ribosome small subunit-dependent GTPase A [Bacillus sp. SM2101]|uniref:ribosome small subunit-dependent GTPase A n=1 Tax=Bacillus sp. SM2101 TaxID=2805366 RepID=UPI001BDEBA92|nr:ribosome small subunit-dependent GTPase A [Bacillus sp. SM2101]